MEIFRQKTKIILSSGFTTFGALTQPGFLSCGVRVTNWKNYP
jgi:hypothetical protein